MREMRPEEAVPCRACAAGGDHRGAALYRVVVPRQNLAVRLNGLDPDAPDDGYLPAVRPYGVLRMACAIWREVPDVAPKRAFSLTLKIRRKGEAEVLVAAAFLADHVGLRLRARHLLSFRLEQVC